MKEYYRLVIDALKLTLSDYVSSGEIDEEMLRETYEKLSIELDRRVVNNLSTEEIEALRNDISWVRDDLLFFYE